MKPSGKFSFLNLKQSLAKGAVIHTGHSETSKCDFDNSETAIGYKIDKDVFYCCKFHKEWVESSKKAKG